MIKQSLYILIYIKPRMGKHKKRKREYISLNQAKAQVLRGAEVGANIEDVPFQMKM